MTRRAHVDAILAGKPYRTSIEFRHFVAVAATGAIAQPRPGLEVQKVGDGLIVRRKGRTRTLPWRLYVAGLSDPELRQEIRRCVNSGEKGTVYFGALNDEADRRE